MKLKTKTKPILLMEGITASTTATTLKRSSEELDPVAAKVRGSVQAKRRQEEVDQTKQQMCEILDLHDPDSVDEKTHCHHRTTEELERGCDEKRMKKDLLKISKAKLLRMAHALKYQRFPITPTTITDIVTRLFGLHLHPTKKWLQNFVREHGLETVIVKKNQQLRTFGLQLEKISKTLWQHGVIVPFHEDVIEVIFPFIQKPILLCQSWFEEFCTFHDMYIVKTQSMVNVSMVSKRSVCSKFETGNHGTASLPLDGGSNTCHIKRAAFDATAHIATDPVPFAVTVDTEVGDGEEGKSHVLEEEASKKKRKRKKMKKKDGDEDEEDGGSGDDDFDIWKCIGCEEDSFNGSGIVEESLRVEEDVLSLRSLVDDNDMRPWLLDGDNDGFDFGLLSS